MSLSKETDNKKRLQSALDDHGFHLQMQEMERKKKREKRALIPNGSPFSNDPDDESQYYPKCIVHKGNLYIGITKDGKNKGRPYFYCKERYENGPNGNECTWKWIDSMIAKDDPKKLKYAEQVTPIAYATMLKYWNQLKREINGENDSKKEKDKINDNNNLSSDSEDENDTKLYTTKELIMLPKPKLK